jgi:hypothetical protein
MSSSLNGTWNNTYGSTMNLLTVDNQIFGTYSSHTGSTGVYLLVGNCTEKSPTQEAGQSVVFSIYWRNIEGSDPDDSWHWTGTMCGQLLVNGKMTLENTIIVSVPFEQYPKGNYVDELVFSRKVDIDSSEIPDIKSLFEKEICVTSQSFPLEGTWANATTTFCIQKPDTTSGLTMGTLTRNGVTISLLGFIDTYAEPSMSESFSFSGFNLQNQETLSVSGWLDVDKTDLMMYEWVSTSTSSENSFMQTRVQAELLVKTIYTEIC